MHLLPLLLLPLLFTWSAPRMLQQRPAAKILSLKRICEVLKHSSQTPGVIILGFAAASVQLDKVSRITPLLHFQLTNKCTNS
jgi:hypothetical protein